MADERYDMIKKYNEEEEIERMGIHKKWFRKEVDDLGEVFSWFLLLGAVIGSIVGIAVMGPFSLLFGFLLFKFVFPQIDNRHYANKLKKVFHGTAYEGKYPPNEGYLNAWIRDFESLEGTIRRINNRKKMYYENAISVLEREMEKCQ